MYAKIAICIGAASKFKEQEDDAGLGQFQLLAF
jgi:hypothetical protein